MLSFKNRFHGHGSLRYVYKNGKPLRSKLFTIKSTDNPRRKDPRFAVVISKKIIKSAVKRNRARRRVFEQIRTQIKKLRPNLDVVVIITSADVVSVEADEISLALGNLFQQAGLYKD